MNENQLQTLLQAIKTLQDLGKVAYFNKGAYNSEVTYEVNDVVSYNGSSYVSLENNNVGNLPTNTNYWSVVASKGEKGDTGKPFVIEKTYESIEDMVADYDNMEVNDYVMIQGNIEEEENATLWTKTDTEVSPYKWVYLADFSGASGITGQTPNIQIGTVTEGNEPSVTRRAGSSNENPILDFVLKTGAKGDTGATGNGISGVSKTSTSGLEDTYTITYTNGNTTDFNVTNGKGITSIAKTGTSGLVDTYTITYNDNTTSTFEITNGEDGEVTQEQLDETNKQVERANMVYNALPKVTGVGESITLDNTAECPMEMIPKATELEQKTTTGKNLYGGFTYTRDTNGITFTHNLDGSITCSGTATANAFSMTTSVGATHLITLQAGTYVISGGMANVYLQVLDQNGTSITNTEGTSPRTFTINSAIQVFVRVQVDSGKAFSTPTKILQMLRLSSTSDTYEPYTNGASPNPDYPQEIHSISGDNEVKVTGKNLASGLRYGYYNSATGIYNSNSTYSCSAKPIYVKSNETYSYSINGNSVKCWAYEYDKDNNYLGYQSYQNGKFTPSSNTYYFNYSFDTGEISNVPLDSKIQIEYGTEVSPYEPYQEQSLPLNLGDLEYCKIGDYEDEFFKNTTDSEYYDENLELDKWYLKKNIGKVVLNGTTEGTWNLVNQAFQLNNMFPSNIATINNSISALSDKYRYKYYSSGITSNIQNNEFAWNNDSQKKLTIRDDRYSTANEFTTALASELPTIYYPTSTTTDIEITDTTLLSQLNALEGANSYNEQTNISQENNDLPFVLKLSAIRDLSAIFDLIENQ